MTRLIQAWKNAQPSIKAKIGDHAYSTWFVHLNIAAQDPLHLVIITPDEFFKNWVIENYLTVIRETLREETKEEVTVDIQIKKTLSLHQQHRKYFPRKSQRQDQALLKDPIHKIFNPVLHSIILSSEIQTGWPMQPVERSLMTLLKHTILFLSTDNRALEKHI